MPGSRRVGLLVVGLAAALCATMSVPFGQTAIPPTIVLNDHPAIQYAWRPTTDRVAALNQALQRGTRTLHRDGRTGYLLPILDALGVSEDSQLLVFSKTGVQRAYTSPHNPRALYFDRSVVIGYVPGAPVLELAAHDPQQGVVFYTLDQNAETAVIKRATGCLMCHVSASTLDVPGMIVRSNVVSDDGNTLPQEGSNDVTHRTPHPDRWGGYYVTADLPAGTYNQRGHLGNITFSGGGVTSNLIFVEWMNSEPESRGYLSPSSDIGALLAFDHQMRAINLLTRLNWESRIAISAGQPPLASDAVRNFATELGDYLLFAGEASMPIALTPRPAFARHLESAAAKDRRGRSFGQLDLTRRLLRYPCSYMIYSDAFDALHSDVKQAVYRRMREVLSGAARGSDFAHLSAEDRTAILEILADTKPGFPRSQ